MEQSQACVIIYNLIVKMEKEGDLDGAVGREGNHVTVWRETLSLTLEESVEGDTGSILRNERGGSRGTE